MMLRLSLLGDRQKLKARFVILISCVNGSGAQLSSASLCQLRPAQLSSLLLLFERLIADF
jgi:hypothetical protein